MEMSLPERHQHPTAAASPLSFSRQSVQGTPSAHPAHPAHPAPEDLRHQYQIHPGQTDQLDETTSQTYENEPFPSIPEAIAQPRHLQFQPFFTLVEDANTGEYHHPTVHYIFSDDDTDILTEAAVRSLEQEQQGIDNQAGTASRRAGKKGQQQQPQHRHTKQGESEEEGSYNEENEKNAILPPAIPGVRDNYLILDVEPTTFDPLQHQKQDADPNHLSAAGGGPKSISSSPATLPGSLPTQHPQQHPSLPQFTVTAANSLTPCWQVLNTELVPAPTFENNASLNEQQDQTQPQPLNGGLMLKIHGTPGQPPHIPAKDKDYERGNQRLEDMMDQFAKRMGELQHVIESGDISGGHGLDVGSGSRTGLDGDDQEQECLDLPQDDLGGD